MNKCSKCKKQIDDWDTYEYRGAFSCADCFDDVIENRDIERNEIIADEDKKTKVFSGLDMSNSVIGKANRELLKPNIEIASKESHRLKKYEGR